MIGSNSVSLKQHAYSIFTASRRQPRNPGEDIPESVQRPMGPSPERAHERAPGGLAEPKVSTPTPTGGVVSALRPEPVPAPALGAAKAPTHDEIRQRAHAKYLARDGQPGDPLADWLEAEAELRRERGLG